MSKSISVLSGDETIYEIMLTGNFRQLPEMLKNLGYKQEQKICIVTDSHVSGLYADQVFDALKDMFPNLFLFVFDAGENSKNLDTVSKLYEDLILHHFDRRDLLVALGGGVVGDLTGFAAATYLRGIDFIQIPTTLLSQVDSSIGGKTGVDLLQYKNMVGSFCQPRLVYMNLEVLQSLPKRQLISGIGEILKYGLIKEADYFCWMNDKSYDILNLVPDVMEEMIYRSCLIKKAVVEHDPKEQGERAILNFGHTIGHAIEKLTDFRLCHGECVGLGMTAASFLSWKCNMITQTEFHEIEQSIAGFGLPVHIDGLNASEVLLATKSDKKMVGSKVKFILLDGIGTAYIDDTLTDEQILDGIRYVCG